MFKADYWKKEGRNIRCVLCQRKCLITKDKSGFCGVRTNQDNILFSKNYGYVSSINVDPIEKKPFYHFYPGSKIFSYGSFGCNFKCQFCCNSDISQTDVERLFTQMSPDELFERAKLSGAVSIAHTYNEPTIFMEYALDVMKLSKAKIKNVFVTNGYISDAPIKKLTGKLDAVVIDFKGNNELFYEKFTSAKLDLVKNGALLYKKLKPHIEITNLVVPNKNNNMDELTEQFKWILKNFGKDTPYHLLRFYPAYEMKDTIDTSITSLEKLRKTAMDIGLNYVYIGNVFEHEGNNTYCPKCSNLLVIRSGFDITKYSIKGDNTCPKCGERIAITGGFTG